MTATDQHTRRADITTLAEAKEALRRFDHETRAWKLATLEARADDAMDGADLVPWMELTMLLAFIVAAAFLAVDIVSRLPNGR